MLVADPRDRGGPRDKDSPPDPRPDPHRDRDGRDPSSKDELPGKRSGRGHGDGQAGTDPTRVREEAVRDEALRSLQGENADWPDLARSIEIISQLAGRLPPGLSATTLNLFTGRVDVG